MTYAVVGHIEWVQFARVERLPRVGEILEATETWEEAAGGGAVAAVQLARLAGEATLFTALGNDELGLRSYERLSDLGVGVEAVTRDRPQRRAFTFIDATGERTITVTGERLQPAGDDRLRWQLLDDADGVYFTAGDANALARARRARKLVATPRSGSVITNSGVPLDALVLSGNDPAEANRPSGQHGLLVKTLGSRGGSYLRADGTGGTYKSVALPGPMVDAYGCGDSFAAGLTFALGAGYGTDDALALAARCGSACLTGRGPYEGQLRRRSDR